MKGDRKQLNLSPKDRALIATAKNSGAPVTTILLSGRPLILDSALADSGAFVAAWLPGTEGQGVADVLFGDYKCVGKLPRTWPGGNEHFAIGDQPAPPLFPFGFGLSD
jgi:beta-glucosidase